ncbi:DUF3325 family protein [Steroidobacter cummioxidans]|uniref:DUF3325 family protein n=1 Tax=Steroidobacter cummioxidans TaxID=1803913 RepID=UPI001290179A|nr:DUF3325 family protein [Steroidobacter cummioxidans]
MDRFDRVVVDGYSRAGWPVEWFGMLTASAVSFVLLLTYYPRLAASLGLGLPVCAAMVTFWSA